MQLGRRRLAPIEIADQADPERDVVQVIAMNMAAIDLAPPAIAHLDLAVSGRCPIPNDKVIGQSILHMPDVTMIIVEHLRIPLTCAAVVHDDKLPLRIAMIRRRAIDLCPHRPGQVTVTRAAPASPAAVKKAIPKAGPLFRPGFFNGQLCRLFSRRLGR